MQDISALLTAHLPHLERYALHLTRNPTEADDLVQDCAERALLKSDLFEAGSNCRAWLFAIMHNLFLNRARRRRVADHHLAELQSRLSRVAPPAQHAAIMLSRTLDAIATLSQEEREALLRLGAQPFSYREISAASGVPINTLKSRGFRARSHLRRIVTGSEADEPVEL